MNGAARVTREVFERLAEEFDVRTCDTGAATSSRSRYHLARVWSYARAAARVMRVHGRRRVLYIGGSGGTGLWYQVVLIAVARAFRWRVVFHHHSYAYLRRHSAAMSALTTLAGERSLHVVLCPDMEKLLVGRYPQACNTLVVSNALFVQQVDDSRQDARARPLRLAHVSNLSMEKGFDVVLNTFERCLRAGHDVELHLAGPLAGPAEEKLLEQTLRRFADRIVYPGPIANDQVGDFMARADLFLFPSRYKNEAEPLVVLEAMASGLPSLTYDVGCSRSLATPGLPPAAAERDFYTAVLAIADGWPSEDFDELRRRSRDHLADLQRGASDAMKRLMVWIRD